MEIHFIHHMSNPFEGYILPNYTGRIDRSNNPGMQAYLESVVAILPGTAIVYVPDVYDLPDSDAVKWDAAASSLIPLDPADITPEVAENTELEARHSDATTRMAAIAQMSHDDIDAWIDNVFNNMPPTEAGALDWISTNVTDLATAKTALTKIASSLYDTREAARQVAHVVLAALRRLDFSE